MPFQTIVMSEREFGTVFAKLALQLRWHDADIAVIHGYFDVLGELDLGAVSAAADRFAREAGRKFPPTSAEWFTLAREIHTTTERVRLALPSGREEPWRHECETCEDTGWILGLECDGGAKVWPEQMDKEKRGDQRIKGNQQAVGYRDQPRLTRTPKHENCGRAKSHIPHSWTRPCICRPTNKTYQRKRAQKYDA